MAQVPGLAACHSRARLAQRGEPWAGDLVQGSVCHKPQHRARCKHRRGVGLCSPALHRPGQKHRAVVHGKLQKKPESPLDFLTNSGHPPCSIPGEGKLAWVPSREPFSCCAEEVTSSHPRWASDTFPCAACSFVGGVEGEAQSGISGQEVPFRMFLSVQSFPLSLREICNMWWQPEPCVAWVQRRLATLLSSQ